MKFTNNIKSKIAIMIAVQKYSELKRYLLSLSKKLDNDNRRFTLEFIEFLETGIPNRSIFKDDGNSKLPFIAFSSLAGEGFCHGAGDCLNWCYSFKGWRYPATFFRQCQNSVLLQSKEGRGEIAKAFEQVINELFEGEPLDFRLYVDGDFSSISDIEFWSILLANNSDKIRAYGYSKSFELFLQAKEQGITMPDNYLLNLSSGHKYGPEMLEKMRALPFVRGEFKAVSIGRKVKSTEHGTKAINKELRASYGKKAFTCAGKCGDCTPKGHACGLPTFNDIDIIIAVH